MGVSLVAILAMQAAGCTPKDREDLCVDIGACTEDPPTEIHRHILCDVSLGSSCDAVTVADIVRTEAPALALVPGSTIHLWIMSGAAPSAPAVTVSVPANAGGNERSVRRRAAAWVENATEQFVQALAAHDASSGRSSPIAETITRIGLASAEAPGERSILVATDGRERSGAGNFECRLPRPERWLVALERLHLLAEGSLRGVAVTFAYVTPRPLERRRCRSNVAHEDAVRSMWAAALTRAGVSRFVFVSGAPPRTPSSIPRTHQETP